MKGILQKTAQSIQMNQQAIERLKAKHLEVSELEGKLVEVQGKLTEAKPWTHAVDVKKLTALTDQADKILQSDQKLIAKFEEGLEERKKIALILLSLIGLVIVFLYLKNESMKKRE